MSIIIKLQRTICSREYILQLRARISEGVCNRIDFLSDNLDTCQRSQISGHRLTDVGSSFVSIIYVNARLCQNVGLAAIGEAKAQGFVNTPVSLPIVPASKLHPKTQQQVQDLQNNFIKQQYIFLSLLTDVFMDW